MTTSISRHDYFLDFDTVIEVCVIYLPDNANAPLIHAQYLDACRSYFKAKFFLLITLIIPVISKNLSSIFTLNQAMIFQRASLILMVP